MPWLNPPFFPFFSEKAGRCRSPGIFPPCFTGAPGCQHRHAAPQRAAAGAGRAAENGTSLREAGVLQQSGFPLSSDQDACWLMSGDYTSLLAKSSQYIENDDNPIGSNAGIPKNQAVEWNGRGILNTSQFKDIGTSNGGVRLEKPGI